MAIEGKVIIGGDGVYAGIDDDDVQFLPGAIVVVTFDSKEELVKAMRGEEITLSWDHDPS